MAEGTPAVAVFDLDGTLTKPFSLPLFVVRLVGAGPAAIAVGRGVLAVIRCPRRRRFKAAVLASVLRDRQLAEVRGVGERFAADLFRLRLRNELADRVAHHRRQGAYLLIVTCALDVYVEPFAAALDFDGVVAAQVLADASGRCTGELHDANLRGDRKARAVEEHLRSAGLDPAVTVVHAYGNSRDDEALLAWARQPLPRPALNGVEATT
jgi:phosphatidylglycerophosphatase C